MRRWSGLLLCILTLPAWSSPVAVSVGPLSHTKGNVPNHEGHDWVNQQFGLDNGTIRYGLQYTACWDPAHGGGAGQHEGCLGMPLPSAANWYHGGFLSLKINGTDICTTRLTDAWMSEQGARGGVKLYFDTPEAGVTMATVLNDGDDRLFTGLLLNPKTEIKTLELRLNCYPSFFTYAYKRDGDRKLLTATQTYKQGENAALDPARQQWLAFYDTIFDPAKGEGDGGCAVAYLGDQVLEAKVDVGSYGCPVTMQLKPDTRLIRLVFWDFNKQPNETALAKLTQNMPGTLEDLRTISFVPLAASQYDALKMAEAAQKDLGTLPGAKELSAKLRAAATEIQALRQQVAEGRAEQPGAVEKALAENIAAFEDLLWEVKFVVLIRG